VDEPEVDIPETLNNTYSPTPGVDGGGNFTDPGLRTPDVGQGNATGAANPLDDESAEIAAAGGTTPGGPGGGIPIPDLTREQMGFGLVVLVGAAAAARRAGLTERAYREVWLRYQPRTDPTRDVERAFERLEYVAELRGRPRRPGETPRQFVEHVRDRRAARLGEIFERAHYGGTVTAAEADEAVELADGLVSDRPGVW
jgi:hypothetical protein